MAKLGVWDGPIGGRLPNTQPRSREQVRNRFGTGDNSANHRYGSAMKTWVILVCLWMATGPALWAAGTEPSKPAKGPASELYARGKEAANEGKYAEALRLFQQSNQLQPHNPDTLNMIAYCYRKLGKLPEAFQFYEKALKLRPRFPAAREYLGEAHLQAVLEQVEILRSYGPDGEEALADLMKAIKEAAGKL